jgi:TM2 domain-containing membrane protein YozV
MTDQTADSNVSDKKTLPTFLLCLLFGVFGAHRFFVGKTGTAILQLCTLGGVGIWACIDLIIIICGAFTDKAGKKISVWV